MSVKITNISKYSDIIITTIQTLAIVLLAAVLTIVKCGFDFSKFDFVSFCFNFLFTTSMKFVYTNFSKNKELRNDEIVLLRDTISFDRKEIYDAQKMDDFNAEIERRNKISKLQAYIDKLDNKRKLNKEERNWAFDYKMALINKQDTTEFERIKALTSIKHVRYEKAEPSKLFNFGQNSKNKRRKLVFNSFKSSLNRIAIPMTVSIAVSVILGTIQNESDLTNAQLWIDLAGYLFSISLGAWWGLNNGKVIIREDYAEVLNNVASLVREVKTEIGVGNNEVSNKS